MMIRQNHRLWAVLAILLCCIAIIPTATINAQITDLLTLSVDAGFEGRFRANQWFPLRIQVQNQGNDIQGRIVVRPETSGSGIPNTYSTPIDLPSNTTQTLFLYITARSNANVIRVELLSDAGNVLTSRDINVRDILPRDRLYAVVTQSTSSTVDLTGLTVGGYDSFQANWTINAIPDHVGALDAVDVMVISDVDTGNLTSAQHEAITAWVTSGGHLIVTGGTPWQATAAGLQDLLPLVPQNTTTTSDLKALTDLAGDFTAELQGETIVATGELNENAVVLAETEDNIPLVIRRELGNGTVDYVTVDPSSQPIRQWLELPELWFSLMSSTNAAPSWSHGFANWERASTAVEILPGLDLLPAALALIGFLAAYVALIGPLNYIILSRINRREWAWITIPILIVVFSALAWSVGFQLRGNAATLSRISVVQSWTDQEEARLDQLIGLLAPRRGNYTLSVTDDRMMQRISPALSSGTALGNSVQTNTDIQQTSRFEAVDFPVDASFIAAFSTRGVTERPAISGSLSLIYVGGFPYRQVLQGSIRNDSEITLNNPVILARGVAYRLAESLEPGAIRTFNGEQLTLATPTGPTPSSLEFAAGDDNPFLSVGTTALGFRGRMSSYANAAQQSAIDILGTDDYQTFNFGVSFSDSDETQETRRRQALLDSFIIDQYGSTSRGNRVYLAGWSDSAPTEETVGGQDFNVVDTTLYLIELEVERDIEPGEEVLITQDQFTWISRERFGVNDVGPNDLFVYSDTEVIFRFTPLPDSVLSEVQELTIIAERSASSLLEDNLDIWNWQLKAWEPISLEREQSITLQDVSDYIGPQNAVQLRILRDGSMGSLFIEQLSIEQRGTF